MSDGPRSIWLHGASVGDARALGPLIAALRPHLGPSSLRLTVGRAAGRDAARRFYPELIVERPPLPWSWPARGYLRRHGIGLLVLEYLELWPGWMRAAERSDVPVIVVDGRVTTRSLRVAPLLRRAAGRISLFCAQAPEDAEAALALGVPADRIHVTGNGKHELSTLPPVPEADLRQALGTFDVVVGSLNPAEIDPATAALAAFRGRVLFAPRYRASVPKLEQAARRHGRTVGRRSGHPASAEWVILDTHGELAAAYALGAVAIAGGTFCAREGQNLVEAAAHGRPVIHGPRVAHVREEAAALAGQGGHRVEHWAAAVERLEALRAGDVAPGDPSRALLALRGAVGRQMRLLRPYLEAVTDR